MTKSSLPSPEIHEHRSIVWHESSCIPKVRFAVRRLSLGQRIELTRRVRELTGKNEFLRAGSEADQLQAALSDLMMRQLFIEWGLAQIDGLHIDGREATTEVLIAKGPEDLAQEIAGAVSGELSLSEQETKNS